MSAVATHKLLLAKQSYPLRHPAAAFKIRTTTVIEKDLKYPRAGVRLQADGKWLLQLWYAPDTVRNDVEPLCYTSRRAAFISGQHDVHAARTQKHPAGQLWLRGTGRNTRP